MKSRYYKIFGADDRALILALDHGGAGKFWLDSGKAIEAAVKGGVDAVLTNYGVAKRFRKEIGHAGLILRSEVYGTQTARIDGTKGGNPFISSPGETPFTVEDAIRLGADAVITMSCAGTEFDKANQLHVAKVAAECDKWGLLNGAEVLVGTGKAAEDYDVESLNTICRAAAEIGADFVKATYINGDDFQKVADNCFVPVVVLGGAKIPDEQLLAQIRDALDHGAKGIAIGRNLWGREDVAPLARALRKLIHEDCTVEEAIEELKK